MVSVWVAEGWLERHALAMGMCAEFDAFDISPQAIMLAKQKADAAGIAHRVHYEVRGGILIRR